MLTLIIAIIAGIVAGTITGLIPGLHINLVAMLLFVSSAFFLQFTTPLVLACFIVAMAITQSFLDFVPAIFLGAPDEDTALSILPGHRFLLKGQGYGAIRLTSLGCLIGTIIACIIAPLFVVASPIFYPILAKAMAFILIGMYLLLILKEEKKILAIIIFFLSGILGIATLNFALIKQPLFPLFTGLFGSSLLIMSFMENTTIPKQNLEKIKISKKEIRTSSILSIISSSLVSFLPGIGAAQAATISSSLKKLNEKIFLVLLGMISTMTMILSFVALYAINKPRTGMAVFIGKLIPSLTINQLWTFLAIAIITAGIAFFLSLFFAKIMGKNITKIKYKWLCLGILIFLIILTPPVSGWMALLILGVATAIGILTSLFGVKKVHMMGSLLLPVIVYYLIH